MALIEHVPKKVREFLHLTAASHASTDQYNEAALREAARLNEALKGPIELLKHGAETYKLDPQVGKSLQEKGKEGLRKVLGM